MHLDQQDYEAEHERRVARAAHRARLQKRYAKAAADGSLVLAFPTGKSMEDPTLELLEKAHVGVHRSHQRECTARLSGLPGFSRALFVKLPLIGKLVREGSFAVGLTALDRLIEDGHKDDVAIVKTLPYGRAGNGGTRCVLLCRQSSKLEDPMSELRRRKNVRVVSEYPEETRAFFRANDIDASVHSCPGSAEALVVAGLYDWGVALTETGTSLKVNGLTEATTIFESQAVLVANPDAYELEDVRQYADFFGRLLAGVIEAREKRYITMNVPASCLDAVKAALPALKSPTVQALSEEGYVAVSSVVPTAGLPELKLKLLKLGASGIVELDACSIV